MANKKLVRNNCQKNNDKDQKIYSLEEDLNSYFKLYERYRSPIHPLCLAKLYRNRKKIEINKEKLPLILRSALEENLGLGWYWLTDLSDREIHEIITNFFSYEKTEIIDQITALFPMIAIHENMEDIIMMMRDKNHNIRNAGANAFVKLANPEDKKDLIKMLDDEDWYVRKTSLRALCKMIEPEDKRDLIKMLYDEDGEVRRTALEVFAKIAKHGDKGRVVEMLHDKDKYIKEIATKIFAKIITPEDREDIIKILDTVDVYAREIATEALETVILEDREDMIDILREYVRKAVLDAFVRIVDSGDRRDLRRMLHSEDWYVRKTSLRALNKIITSDDKGDIITPDDKGDIIKMLYDEDEEVKEAAAKVFARITTHDDKEKVIEMLYDEDEFVRKEAARVFPEIAKAADIKDIIRTLHNKDVDWEVRRTYAEAFAKIATREDREDITKMLFDKDNYIQEIAAEIFIKTFEFHEIETFLDFLSERAQGYGEDEERHFGALSILDRKLYYPYSSAIERIRLKRESKVETTDLSEYLDVANYQECEGEKLKKELHDLDCGHQKWREYEELVVGIFQYLFVSSLGIPIIQKYTSDGLERRDILFQNISDDFFWRRIREKHDGEFILVECKNYCKKIGKKEVRDASQYLRKKSIGRFGLIASRKFPSKSAIKERKQEFRENDKLILFVDDETLNKMIDKKIQNEEPVDVLNDLRAEFLIKY